MFEVLRTACLRRTFLGCSSSKQHYKLERQAPPFAMLNFSGNSYKEVKQLLIRDKE